METRRGNVPRRESMHVTEIDDDRFATHDGQLTALVGVEPDRSVAEVRTALPDDVAVLEGRQDDVLGYMTVVLPTTDVDVADEMNSNIAGVDGVAYVEHNPVYDHPYIGDRLSGRDAPASGMSEFERSVRRDFSDTAHGVRRFIERLFGDDAETGDPRLSDQYAPEQVGALRAQSLLPDDPEYTPTLAVIDTGVDYTHPDLREQFGEYKGRDFGTGDGNPAPDFGLVTDHGSHVAGIAGATVGNGEGIAGIAGVSDTRLLSAKIFGGETTALGAIVAEAIRWATDEGADVINMSLGGGERTGLPSETVRRAVQYADDSGTLVVAATGNSGESPVMYPAKHPEVVGVTATDENGEVASFPNFGEDADITAPGRGVLSTVPPFKGISPIGLYYGRKSGTSMASPAVCGVALLGILAAEGDVTTDDLRNALARTAEEIPDTPTEKQGAGIARADRLVDDLLPEE